MSRSNNLSNDSIHFKKRYYYENYANMGLVSFILFFLFSIFLFIYSPMFGSIAITMVIHNLITHILKKRYQYSVVEESPVLDLDLYQENENSLL